MLSFYDERERFGEAGIIFKIVRVGKLLCCVAAWSWGGEGFTAMHSSLPLIVDCVVCVYLLLAS